MLLSLKQERLKARLVLNIIIIIIIIIIILFKQLAQWRIMRCMKQH